MKARVIKRFKDKYTGERFLPGDLFEGETARINELMARGFIGPAEIKNLDYSTYTKKELARMLDDKRIAYDLKDKKDTLISLLGGE